MRSGVAIVIRKCLSSLTTLIESTPSRRAFPSKLLAPLLQPTQPRSMIPQPHASPQKESEIVTDIEQPADSHHEEDGNDPIIDPNAQAGVQNIEAVTVAWTTAALTFAYVMMWLTCMLENAL